MCSSRKEFRKVLRFLENNLEICLLEKGEVRGIWLLSDCWVGFMLGIEDLGFFGMGLRIIE